METGFDASEPEESVVEDDVVDIIHLGVPVEGGDGQQTTKATAEIERHNTHSRKSRSMKKKTGRSTSSLARIFCSSKQKHSTLAK